MEEALPSAELGRELWSTSPSFFLEKLLETWGKLAYKNLFYGLHEGIGSPETEIFWGVTAEKDNRHLKKKVETHP